MPTYDYICDSCGHSFETVQRMSDPTLEVCPACGTPSLRRVISGGTGVIFKGSGFYVNDSRAGNTAPKTSEKTTESTTESAGTTKEETKAENKTETKTEKKSEKISEQKSA